MTRHDVFSAPFTLGERIEARAATLSTTVRQALVAAGGMRFLVGFLLFHLAFALRREHFGTVGVGSLIAAAAAGTFLGALVAPLLMGLGSLAIRAGRRRDHSSYTHHLYYAPARTDNRLRGPTLLCRLTPTRSPTRNG
jgi:hypothetical protein